MKTILKLTVLAAVGTVALALAGNAFATQKLTVRQTASSLTIKISQAQTDAQPAKISTYVPTGYTINASAAPGTKIGTTTGTVFARDQNIPLPLSGDVMVAPPSTNAPGCATGTHLAVWILALSVAGQNVNLPVHVDQTAGAEQALGAYKLVICLGSADTPAGTPGRSPNGAQLLDATFTVDNVFTSPAGQSVWKAVTTPYATGTPLPNAAGTVETRAIAGATGTLTIASKVTSRARRVVTLSGRVAQGGAAVSGARVSILVAGKARFAARTNASGRWTLNLRKTGKVSSTVFQARTTVAEHDVTGTACTSPSAPPVPCVSATSSSFTALSRKLKVKI